MYFMYVVNSALKISHAPPSYIPTWKSLSKIESTKLVDFINLTTYTLALCILYFQNVFSSVGRDQAATGDGLDIHHGDDYL